MTIFNSDRYYDYLACIEGCPKCKIKLVYFCDYDIEFLYCPICQDKMYDVFTGKIIGRLE